MNRSEQEDLSPSKRGESRRARTSGGGGGSETEAPSSETMPPMHRFQPGWRRGAPRGSGRGRGQTITRLQPCSAPRHSVLFRRDLDSMGVKQPAADGVALNPTKPARHRGQGTPSRIAMVGSPVSWTSWTSRWS
jgi:hypothetical protein